MYEKSQVVPLLRNTSSYSPAKSTAVAQCYWLTVVYTVVVISFIVVAMNSSDQYEIIRLHKI